MNIQCECASVKGEVSNFPKQSPGRLVCYCDDCQTFLHYINKEDLLDINGGTEIIPIYPSNFKITQGQDLIRGIRLSPKGLYRWYASCCQTPIANTQAKLPWVGMLSVMLPLKDEKQRTDLLGEVKSRVMGKFAKGTAPKNTANKFSLRDFLTVAPFILKGFVFGKNKNNPFFLLPTFEPKSQTYVLTKNERLETLKKVLSST